ncbi:IS66 family insertion sequence element accessory protein TnpA, partial [Undibacterium sp.]|uniref:IS66 family insertion sequence element accessory protein TnpA n=1 Tax=Undibacterium sp. TaxID=1914977 RepID=UPI00374CB743
MQSSTVATSSVTAEIFRLTSISLRLSDTQQSGLSQKAFCEQQPIAAHQFCYWHKIYRLQ